MTTNPTDIRTHDIKTLGECAVLLRQTKNKLQKKARHIKYDPIAEYLGAAIAVLENHARHLENRYQIIRKLSNDSNNS